VKHTPQINERATLQAEIAHGLSDLAEGRVNDFDPNRIVERGKTLLAGGSPSA
jgi:antitoxin ParD1/3/4